MITTEDINFYDTHGYVIIKDVVPEKLRQDILKAVLSMLTKYQPELRQQLQAVTSWDDPFLHTAMMRFRTEQPQQFGLFYDTMFNSLALQQFYFHPSILNLAAVLLREEPFGLSAASFVLRMDVPQDTRNVLNWHQDSSYFQPAQSGSNGLVAWVPLLNVNKENGTVIVCSGSHKEGRIAIPATYQGQGYSHQFTVPLEYVEKYPRVDVVAHTGDVVFFNMDIIHKSGQNTSANVRFSALGRYHRILTQDYTPGKFFFKPSVGL